MAVKVRDALENIGYSVSYDPKSGGVVVSGGGKTANIGSENFKLADDGRYYADSENDVFASLAKQGLGAGNGWQGARNYLGDSEYVGYNPETGQMTLNGKAYNMDGKNLVKIGDKIYGRTEYLDSLREKPFENEYKKTQDRALSRLENRKYEGYDPEKDKNYQNAMKNFMKSAKADMGSRGMISDSLAAFYAAQGAEKLLPEFEAAHYKRFLDESDTLRDVADTANQFAKTDLSAYRADNDAKQKKYSRIESESEQRQKDISNAINRTKTLGYVTYKDAEAMGAEGGTQSGEMKNKESEREHSTSQLREKHENEKELRDIDEYNRDKDDWRRYLIDTKGKFMDYEIWKNMQDVELKNSITLEEKKALLKFLGY